MQDPAAEQTRNGNVQKQYERWPYPHVPLMGAVPRHQTWQLHADFWRDRCGLDRGPKRPRIWIAGCGTMQPYVFRLANPDAAITATDISRRSLRIARRRCLWHGQYGVEFGVSDLTDPSTCPEGPFDVIECYGVLMNLPDPGSALRALRDRLAPDGVLRIMVYPHYSRRRIFQVQRVAKLCGLRFERREDPRRLRQLIARLPRTHPLRFAFDDYADAKNDAGLVDGFLHAGDRGFTGLELGALCEGAGLQPAFWFARPWARPDVMANRLSLEDADPFLVAHYLDLWQELRGNFVVCLTRTDQPQATSGNEPDRLHPGLALGAGRGLLEQLQRRIGWRIRNMRAPDRLSDHELQLHARILRRAQNAPNDLPPDERDHLRDLGVLLGGPREAPRTTDHTAHLRTFGPAAARVAEAPGIPDGLINPFYQHLWEAWFAGSRATGLDEVLPDLRTQLDRWRPEAEPLESEACPTGLTPYGTIQHVGVDTIERLVTDGTRGNLSSELAIGTPSTPPLHDLLRGIVDTKQLPSNALSELATLLNTSHTLLAPEV